MGDTGKRKRKIGLALGSGAARGMAHIGVLKVLEEEGIDIDVIAGTSVGALIGALYAAGVSCAQMEEIAENVDWRQMARLIDPIIPTSGLIDGKKVALFIESILPAASFEELRIPLAVVATDVETGESLILRKGNLREALRAAIAFPGIFTPVRFGSRFLVDGGLCNPVPADVARELGADRVIGVCAIPGVRKAQAEAFFPMKKMAKSPKTALLDLLNSQSVESTLKEIWRPARRQTAEMAGESKKERKPPGIFRICAQSVAIMENEINALRLERNDIDFLIRPDLDGITLLEFHRASEAVRAGEEATRALLAKEKHRLKSG